jgi:hypothetical protein
MKARKYTSEQIIGILEEAEIWAKTADFYSKYGMITALSRNHIMSESDLRKNNDSVKYQSIWLVYTGTRI